MGKILMLPSFYPKDLDLPRGSFFQEQAQLLKELGADIDVVFCENRSISTLSIKRILNSHFQTIVSSERGVRVMRKKSWNVIPTKLAFGKRILINKFINLADTYINRFGKPDLIHVQCCFPAGFVALYLKRKYRIPYIITEHSSGMEFSVNAKQLASYREVFENADRSIVVSSHLKMLMVSKFGLCKDEVEVIPNFIDTDFFQNANGPLEPKNILTVSYHTENKNIALIIKAFHAIANLYPYCNLLVGGVGPETARLKQLVVNLNLGNRVLFLGFLSKEQVKYWLQYSSMFVLASHFETFGVVLIESMAMGVPVISTKSGGPSDILTSETGIFVDEDENSLQKAMVSVLSNTLKFSKEVIRCYAVGKFSKKAVGYRYLSIYNEYAPLTSSN